MTTGKKFALCLALLAGGLPQAAFGDGSGLNVKIEDGLSSAANQYLSAVMRKGADRIELNYQAQGATKSIAAIPVEAGGERAASLEEVKTVWSSGDKAALDAIFKDRKGGKLGLRLVFDAAKPFVETQPLGGTARIRVELSASSAVMPDIVGYDLLLNAEKLSADKLRLPWSRQTALLNFMDDGDAIAMLVWQSPRQKAIVELTGAGRERRVSAIETDYDKTAFENIWLAILAAPGIWHKERMEKIPLTGAKLDWNMPFDKNVQWRVDFRRDPDGLVESWFAIRQGGDGSWPGCNKGARTCWVTGAGHPAYIENGAMHLANSTLDDAMTVTCYKEPGDLSFNTDEDVIIYPYDYIGGRPATPLFAREVIRSALANTPEAQTHALAYPKILPTHRFAATCSRTERLEKIFDDRKEKERTAEVLDLIHQVKFFVWSVRERVEEQLKWSEEMRKLYAAKKAENPRLGKYADMFDETTARMQAVYKRQLPTMKQPKDCSTYTDLLEEVLMAGDDKLPGIAGRIRALGQEIKTEDEKDKATLVKALGKLIRTIGGSQDGCTGRMRKVVKSLHQEAGIAALTAPDEASFNFISEVRAKTAAHMDVFGAHEIGQGLFF